MAITWTQRLKRVFEATAPCSRPLLTPLTYFLVGDIDIEICRECGGAVRVIAAIEDPAVIKKILTHLTEKASSAEPREPACSTKKILNNWPTRNVAGDGDTTVGIQEGRVHDGFGRTTLGASVREQRMERFAYMAVGEGREQEAVALPRIRLALWPEWADEPVS